MPCQMISSENVVKKKKMHQRRHTPHSEQPRHLVEKRNFKERKRVGQLNEAYRNLRKHLPIKYNGRRVSKGNILLVAIDYINHMRDLISEHDFRQLSRGCSNCFYENNATDFSQMDSCSNLGLPRQTKGKSEESDHFEGEVSQFMVRRELVTHCENRNEQNKQSIGQNVFLSENSVPTPSCMMYNKAETGPENLRTQCSVRFFKISHLEYDLQFILQMMSVVLKIYLK